MDPLTAFGIACNVIQVVDFGLKAISKCREVHAKGSTKENLDVAYLTGHLSDLCDDLTGSLATPGAGKAAVFDLQLRNLAVQCAATSRELLGELKKLEADPKNKVQIFKKTLEIIWKRGRIQDAQTKLEGYRKTLDTRILARLSRAIDEQARNQIKASEKLNKVQWIAEGLAKGQRTVSGLVAYEHRLTRQLMEAESSKTRQSLLDRSIAREQRVDDQHSATRQSINNEGFATRQHVDKQTAQLQNAIFSQQQCRDFIQSLWFHTINARQENIADSHALTFQWIFNDSGAPLGGSIRSGHEYIQWSNFVQWLKGSFGVYWINGKVGSGKSTLMNYICDDERTQRHLKDWAGSHELLVLKFFFWRTGTTEQKSVSGLLRSLIHQILVAKPMLVPLLISFVIGDNGNPTEYGGPAAIPAWTMKRLVSALQFLVQQTATPLRFCFFLDGLDEFDGKYQELLEMIRYIDKMAHVKICVSSRPIEDFEPAFKSSARLRLQDLTFEDLAVFVNDRLENDKVMRACLAKDRHRADVLRQRIPKKAQGVFLWVVLAVRELLEGIEYNDSFEQLEERLRLLPDDLNNLYANICGRIPNVYREEAAILLRMMVLSSRVHFERLSVLDFVFGMDRNLVDTFLRSRDLEAAIRLFEERKIVLPSRCEEMKTRIRTRCAGLLDIGRRSKYSENLYIDGCQSEVEFLHRSAHDFLVETEEGKNLLGLNAALELDTIATHFNRLQCSMILGTLDFLTAQVKGSRFLILHLKAAEEAVHRELQSLMDYACMGNSLSHDSLSMQERLIDKTESVLEKLGKLCASDSTRDSVWYLPWNEMEVIFANSGPAQDFLGLLATQGLGAYVSTKLSQKENPTKNDMTYLLSCTVYLISREWDGFVGGNNSPDICTLAVELLHRGADPNVVVQWLRPKEKYGTLECSIWHYFLCSIAQDYSPELKGVLEAFLQAGAILDNEVSATIEVPETSHHEFHPATKTLSRRLVQGVGVYLDKWDIGYVRLCKVSVFMTPICFLQYHWTEQWWFTEIEQLLLDWKAPSARRVGKIQAYLHSDRLLAEIGKVFPDADSEMLMEAYREIRRAESDDDASTNMAYLAYRKAAKLIVRMCDWELESGGLLDASDADDTDIISIPDDPDSSNQSLGGSVGTHETPVPPLPL